MVSEILFAVLVALVACQRLYEVRVSRAHERALLARGGLEHARGQMPWMVALHTAWLIAMPLEVFLLERAFRWPLAVVALLVFAVAQTLRIWAMRTLGPRWTVKVFTLPGEPPVTGGPFRFLRHPNYLGVVLEILALPLVHGAFITSLSFTVLNGLLLRARIAAEERALAAASDYEGPFRDRRRLVPGRVHA